MCFTISQFTLNYFTWGSISCEYSLLCYYVFWVPVILYRRKQIFVRFYILYEYCCSVKFEKFLHKKVKVYKFICYLYTLVGAVVKSSTHGIANSISCYSNCFVIDCNSHAVRTWNIQMMNNLLEYKT